MRIKIKLRSTESPYFYTTTKNKKAEKLERIKYDPTKGVRRHVRFKEEKI